MSSVSAVRKGGGAALALIATAQFMVIMDTSIIGVALATANWLGFAAGTALAGTAIDKITPAAGITLAAAAALVAARRW